MEKYLLSYLIFTPLLVALLLLFVKSNQHNVMRILALIATLIQLLISILVIFRFESNFGHTIQNQFQFVEKYDWISLSLGKKLSFNIEYHLGVDGISLYLVLLSAVLLIIGVISSWKLTRQIKGYFVLYLLLSSSIMGSFLALDFFLFYLFFELMLLPMFFLIGIWGGPRRSYASIKFFIYTLIGSLLILAAMIALYLGSVDPQLFIENNVVHTFNFLLLYDVQNMLSTSVLHPLSTSTFWGLSIRSIAFMALFFGFAIKLPIVPLHTWLPDAHVEAPTAISVILAGLLLKVGGYGFFRIAFPIFPDIAVEFSTMIAVIGVISIIYGGLNALAQRDLKRMVAYSSVSHMGFVLLGLATMTVIGQSGALFHMISHGLISGALFLLAGVIYDRSHDRLIENYSGLASKLPYFTGFTVLVFFASLGLPGLSGFVGELLVLMGAFSAGENISVGLAIVAVFGVLVSATYYLWTIQRMFFGPYWVRKETWESKMKDLNRREWLMLLPLAILILFLGIFPASILEHINYAIEIFVNHIRSSALQIESMTN